MLLGSEFNNQPRCINVVFLLYSATMVSPARSNEKHSINQLHNQSLVMNGSSITSEKWNILQFTFLTFHFFLIKTYL